MVLSEGCVNGVPITHCGLGQVVGWLRDFRTPVSGCYFGFIERLLGPRVVSGEVWFDEPRKGDRSSN